MQEQPERRGDGEEARGSLVRLLRVLGPAESLSGMIFAQFPWLSSLCIGKKNRREKREEEREEGGEENRSFHPKLLVMGQPVPAGCF